MISKIKFRNLDVFGDDLPLPDGRCANSFRCNELRKALLALGVPVTADMPKSRMCGIYSQVLEYFGSEIQFVYAGRSYPIGRHRAARRLARMAA